MGGFGELNADERLAEICEAIVGSGMRVLVMGGHAVRFYGVERTTIDYDLHLTGADWERLEEVLERALSLPSPIVEGPSWRPRDFRRFVLGRLSDGREERLECWRQNHLLAPFSELYTRRSEGTYGGRTLAFLGLKDLIRSKETEREDDWRDIELLEEILDERLKAKATDAAGRIACLSELRSRRGFESALRTGLLEDRALVTRAGTLTSHPVPRAYLEPFSHPPLQGLSSSDDDRGSTMIDEILRGPLRRVEPGSSRHLALVEAVRRLYKRSAMDADRKDKLSSTEL